jgi:diguanylate cyclase (GGDEF)-like protein
LGTLERRTRLESIENDSEGDLVTRRFAELFPSAERESACTGLHGLGLQLSAAVMDDNHALVKKLLAQLLRCGAARADEEMPHQLAAIEDLIRALRSMAFTDDLTALFNRRGFLRAGTRLLRSESCERQGATLIYVDVDNLKSVNDSAGHDAGDSLLRRTAQLLRCVLDESSVLGRLGGDEFAALIPSTDPSDRAEILRRLQQAVAACNSSRHVLPLSLSIGTAQRSPSEPASILALLERADRAMYGDKRKRFHGLGRAAACR